MILRWCPTLFLGHTTTLQFFFCLLNMCTSRATNRYFEYQIMVENGFKFTTRPNFTLQCIVTSYYSYFVFLVVSSCIIWNKLTTDFDMCVILKNINNNNKKIKEQKKRKKRKKHRYDLRFINVT